MFRKTTIQTNAVKLLLSKAKEFLLVGGSRSGKTFITIYAILVIALKYPGSRHLIARFRFNAAKNAIWYDTLKKVLKICFPTVPVKWNNQDFFITLPNGSEIWLGGLDDKDRTEKVLGMEFLTIFLNEASQISYDAYNTIKTRLAQLCSFTDKDGNTRTAKNMLFVDENPPSKKHWTYQVFIEGVDPEDNKPLNRDDYASLKMNPIDNMENISPEYMKVLESMPKRKRDRFLKGEFADDSEFALWDDDMINRNRLQKAPPLKRVVIAVDPAVTSKDTSDETGIVVEGICAKGFLHVLADLSGVYTPTQWANVVAKAFKDYSADRVIGEANNGGDLIETVLRTTAPNIPYKSVHATRDKFTRAEPVAALYEQDKAKHVGDLPELELEMTTWEGKKGEKSPNRIDALVWGAFELGLTEQRAAPDFGW